MHEINAIQSFLNQLIEARDNLNFRNFDDLAAVLDKAEMARANVEDLRNQLDHEYPDQQLILNHQHNQAIERRVPA